MLCGGAARGPVSRQRGTAWLVVAALAVLIAAMPSSATTRGAATAALIQPPLADVTVLVARLERLEAQVQSQAREASEARAKARALELRVAVLEVGKGRGEQNTGEGKSWSGESNRRLQAPSERGDVVRIHRANVTSPARPGLGASSNFNGGHRRYLQTGGQCANMAARAQSVQARCCDEPTEDCSSGYPRTCNAGCAAVFLPFWAECGALLNNAAVYQQTASLCRQAQQPSPGPGLAHEFNLVCANGAVGGCVPACSEALHGDLLLMNLNGEDSKYS
eukprot:COSAG01_NODE_20310_length_960_cov_1.006969_1_plen_277_part_01